MTHIAWVVGSRGLLGASISRAIDRREGWERLNEASLPWDDDAKFKESVREHTRELLRAAAANNGSWTILWAAGAAFTSSSQQDLDRELEQFRSFLSVVADEASEAMHHGSIFLSSSGGGVYAGSTNPPFSENTAVAPLSPYGHFKVEMEQEATEFALRTGLSTLIGRISNLYGPGQRPNKLQGLITHLGLARFGTKPVFLFVPVETVRDYVYVDDCAALVLACMERLVVEGRNPANAPTVVTKILSSGVGVSIGTLLGYYRGVLKSAPRVVQGVSESTKFQAIDLRMKSVVWPDLDRRATMPLAAGFHSTMLDVLRLVARGR